MSPFRPIPVLAALKRAGLLAGLWVIVAGLDGLYTGLAAVFMGTLASLWLLPPGTNRLNLLRTAALLPGFLWRSLLGGIDVAWRALHPNLPIRPGWIHLETDLPDGPARTLFGTETSLLPGTLSAGCRDGRVEIHCLDADSGTQAQLEIRQQRIGGVFAPGETRAEGVDR